MKTTVTVLLAGLFVLAAAGHAAAFDERRHQSDHQSNQVSDPSFDIDDDGTLCLEHQAGRIDRIKITSDYVLYINGRRIKTDDEADRLLEEYYNQAVQMIAAAEKLGLKAGVIGLRGGELGLNAVGGLARAFLTEYELDDLERDLEREADKLEEAAAGLEDEAADVEDAADELQEIAEDLSYEVPELRKMRWFYD